MCTVPLQVSLSLENCQNYVSSSSEAEVSKVVEPGQMEFLLHVRRQDFDTELIMNHTFKAKELE